MPKINAISLPLPEFVSRLASLAESRGVPLYLVGGALRDYFLGEKIKDWDLAGELSLLEGFIGETKKAGYAWFYLDQETRQIRIILDRETVIDFLPLLPGQTIAEDLARRDFTLNAMAFDFNTGELLDPQRGRRDLENRVLRQTSPGVFIDDPVRLLRGLRISRRLGLELEKVTLRQIKKDAHSLATAAPERIRDEVFKMLEDDKAFAGVKLLEKTGLFGVLFPEFDSTRGVGVNEEHLFDVYRHSFEVLKAADRAAKTGLNRFPACSGRLEANFQTEITPGRKRRGLFKLAALLHDLGKPGTLRWEADGSLSFHGHPHLGGEIAEAVAKRLALSGEETAYLKILIANHMRPLLLARQGSVSPRARYRLFRDLGEELPDLLLLAAADLKAGMGNKPEKVGEQAYLELCRELLKEYYHPTRLSSPPKLLNGNQVMGILKLSPGPRVGEILKELEELAALGKVQNSGEAEAWVLNHAGSPQNQQVEK